MDKFLKYAAPTLGLGGLITGLYGAYKASDESLPLEARETFSTIRSLGLPLATAGGLLTNIHSALSKGRTPARAVLGAIPRTGAQLLAIKGLASIISNAAQNKPFLDTFTTPSRGTQWVSDSFSQEYPVSGNLLKTLIDNPLVNILSSIGLGVIMPKSFY